MGTHRVSQDALKYLLPVIAAGLGLGLAGSFAARGQPTPAATVDVAPAQPKVAKADLQAANANPIDTATLERLLSALPQVAFDDDGTPRRYYVWDGDMLLDRDEVQGMLLARFARQQPVRDGELLLQVRADGQPSVWARPSRRLTYAVDCSTFQTPSQCATVKTALATAAADWRRICVTCGVRFQAVNGSPNVKPRPGGNPHFVVRYEANAFDYLAIAFFANDPVFKRYVGIGPGYFTTSFDKTGVMRHELGHVLGYRHEHNRAPTGCFFEDNNWKPLTAYDPKSVMHYLCGQGGSKMLSIQASDIDGHKIAYGG